MEPRGAGKDSIIAMYMEGAGMAAELTRVRGAEGEGEPVGGKPRTRGERWPSLNREY